MAKERARGGGRGRKSSPTAPSITESLREKQGGITGKQLLFLHEYLVDLDGLRAARAAGYSDPATMSSRLLNGKDYPEVTMMVDAALKRRREESEVKARDLMDELTKVAFLDPRRLFADDETLLNITTLPKDVAACIREFDVTYRTVLAGQGETSGQGGQEGGGKKGKKKAVRVKTVKVKLYDKMEALSQLAKHLGLFHETNNQINLINIDWARMMGAPAGEGAKDRFNELIEAAARGEVALFPGPAGGGRTPGNGEAGGAAGNGETKAGGNAGAVPSNGETPKPINPLLLPEEDADQTEVEDDL